MAKREKNADLSPCRRGNAYIASALAAAACRAALKKCEYLQYKSEK